MREWRYSSTIHELGTSWRCVVSFTPLPLCPRKVPSTHWIRGWVGPRVGLDAVKKIKILRCWESNLGRAARSPSLYQLLSSGVKGKVPMTN
jgi:hypothetical protein